jgi:16S rRNA processing protein RimM
LTVKTVDGIELGKVVAMLETGANDVLVVRGIRESIQLEEVQESQAEGGSDDVKHLKPIERLIPYVPDQYVVSIDLEQEVMVVDWDPEF